MKILITGGAGYIGSKLAFELIKKGHEVTIFDNLRYGQRSLTRLDNVLEGKYSFEDSFKEKLFLQKFKNFDIKILNLIDIKRLSKAFENFDLVFHFGEIVGIDSCHKNPHYTQNTNFLGTKNVIDMCEKYGCKLIYNSSSSVYGYQSTNGFITEEAELPPPTDEYVRNKLLIENYLKTKKFDWMIFRPATVGGLSFRMRMELLPHHFTYALQVNKHLTLSLPEHYRAIVHIDDVVRGYLLVVNNIDKISRQIYNIGNDDLNLKKIDFVNKILKFVKNAEIIKKEGLGDVRNLRITSQKFSNEFKYRPVNGFEEITAPLIKILKNNPDTFKESENYNEPWAWSGLLK